MKRIAFIVTAAGTFAGVMALGTLMTGQWWLSPYALIAAGALLILAAALAAAAGGLDYRRSLEGSVDHPLTPTGYVLYLGHSRMGIGPAADGRDPNDHHQRSHPEPQVDRRS